MIRKHTLNIGNSTVEAACFEPEDGVKEYHLLIHACPSSDFNSQLESLQTALRTFLDEEIRGATPVFMRYFLSDASNQQQAVKEASAGAACPVSIIEQAPLDGTKAALWVYLTTRLNDSYSHLWTASNTSDAVGSELQTSDILREYESALVQNGCSVADNCIRTWFFVQNVDVNYAGVVKGRREYFDAVGLTPKTHYIASTGIAGRTASAESKVMMDAYSIKGLEPQQITYLKGSTHLNPTHEYGVTFERGTSVDYGDRRHVFISGTASINNKGEVVHPGDVGRQTERMMENVDILLQEAGCGYEDVPYMIVYLRDISDATIVRQIFDQRFPTTPKVFLWAPVCRPGWLVEMECMAVMPADNRFEKL